MKQDSLNTLARLIHTIRRVNTDIPLQYVLCLIEIARTPDISVTGLAQKTQIKLPTVSRIVGALLAHCRIIDKVEIHMS